MRRSAQVLLVLMGGGLVTAAAVPLLRQQDCDPAAVQGGACQPGSSGARSSGARSSSGGSTSLSRSTGVDGTTSTVSASVARGGFGATGAAHASSSGG